MFNLNHFNQITNNFIYLFIFEVDICAIKSYVREKKKGITYARDSASYCKISMLREKKKTSHFHLQTTQNTLILIITLHFVIN